MKVKNKKCIRNLSFKTLKIYKKRNIIAIAAIALMSLLFTSVFTVFFSINTSHQNHTFRQIGSYAHGAFKNINESQITSILKHPKIKDFGVVSTIGIIQDGVFLKNNAEVKYMDANTAKWSFCLPEKGFLPQKINEIALDTKALDLLGIPHKIGEKVKILFQLNTQGELAEKFIGAEFILSGYWEYDNLVPVHFILISKDYFKKIENEIVDERFTAFRMDLNVMLNSSLNIRKTLERVESDLGFQFQDSSKEGFIPIGVNWAYTLSKISALQDISVLVSISVFLFLILCTCFLIIYNVFQISVNEDTRYYGLLKTIGVTSRQLKKIVGLQLLILSCIGIPIGLFAGYVVGFFVVPMIISQGNLSYKAMTISFSPFIFLSAIVFSLFTVFFSCIRPAKIAGKVSPVEAAGYYRGDILKKKSRKTRGSKIYRMAFANIGRNKAKTLFILLSLSFSVLLFYTVFTLVKGMDSEKYLKREICADFIVGSASYFRFQPNDLNSLDHSLIEYIKKNTEQSIQGCSYVISDSLLSDCRIDKDCHIILQGLDTDLFSKLTVVKGEVFSLEKGRENMIAIVVYEDDYGNIVGEYPKIGDIVTVSYKSTKSEHTVMYKIAAIVKMPYSMGTRFQIRNSYKAVLHSDVLRRDSGSELQPLFYLFDVVDNDSELKAEAFLNGLSKNVHSDILYESKSLARKKFNEFKTVFFILGNCFCFVVGLIGVLNFFNGFMTSILSRRKELAVLQAVGMTGKQLKRLLIYESLYICTGIFIFSSFFTLCFAPIFSNLMQKIFWFFTYKFSPAPLYILILIFGIMGVILPCIIYSYICKNTIVERFRDI